MPAGIGRAEIDHALDQKRDWITRKVAASEAVLAKVGELGLDRPGVVWLEGEALPIRLTSGGRSIARRAGEVLEVGGTPAAARTAIERWYRRQARQRIRAALDDHAGRLGLAGRSMAIRDQRTRWASCSPLGNLSFSWRLVLAPREVLNYVVIHELCHLRVPNHGKDFWRLLDQMLPGWREASAWLRDHGAELRGYQVCPTSK